MVKTNRSIILWVTILSGIATIFLIVSLTTRQWVTARGKLLNNEQTSNALSTIIKYGLFSGTFVLKSGEPTYYEIKMTCLISDNACAYLCETNAKSRKDQLQKLVKGEYIEFNETCPHLKNKQRGKAFGINFNEFSSVNEREFLNAGLYISTNIFLGISLLFGFLATIFSICIFVINPIEIGLSIYAVYTYNIVACVSTSITLILWGTLFRINIINNIGILYTIQKEMDTNVLVNLGFSYWLILPSCLFYLISIVVVHVKQYPIRPELETRILISGRNEGEEINYY